MEIPALSLPSQPPSPTHEPDACLPCRKGFEGLSETERATRAEIIHRAHSIWRNKGCPEGSQLADWLQAEAEVQTER